METKEIINPYNCLFELSANGGCVGTTHDKCKNCNKRAKFIMAEMKAERDPMAMFKSAKPMKIERPELKKQSELSVHNQVCKYLKAQYPNVMFLSDFAAGIKMSIGMASRQSMQKSGHAFPDIMVFEPNEKYKGLFIEVKKDDSIFYKDTRNLKPVQHVLDQQNCINLLRSKGYYADFCCGFDEAKSTIDIYFTPHFKPIEKV